MNRFKAVLFDKDGTLLDFNQTWLPPYYAAAHYLTTISSTSVDADEILKDGGYIAKTTSWQPDSLLASGSNRQIIDRWEALLDIKLGQRELDEIGAIFTLNKNQYIPVFSPLRPCLEQLKDSALQLGIATMDDESHAINMAEGLEIRDLFDFICGADSGYGVKPEPGMVDAFSEKTGIPTQQIVMVGDSPRDINMGIHAGAGLSVGVLTGAHDRTELLKYTSHVLNSIDELWDYLQKLDNEN